MKVKQKTSFPYPIWGWSDDYKTPFEGKDDECSIVDISDTNDFVYQLKLLVHNDDIDRLIENGDAVYACSINCTATYYHDFITSTEPSFTVRIPRKEVNKIVSIEWMIVATNNIEFQSETLNADYEGKVLFPRGAMIGYINSFEINATISDELRSLGDIIVVVKNTNDDKITYNLYNDQIIIALPESELSVFNDYGSRFASILHSTIVSEALTRAIMKLGDVEYEKYDWNKIIRQYIDCIEDESIPSSEEINENVDYDTIRDIVNIILDKPLKRMFAEMKQIAETTNSEQS